MLGGWQFNGFFTFQSGAPFTVLNGSDPTGALSGINTLVGDAIRPNVYTNLDVSRMSVEQLFALDQSLRAQARPRQRNSTRFRMRTRLQVHCLDLRCQTLCLRFAGPYRAKQ